MADYDTGLDIAKDVASRAGELEFTVAELQAEIRRYVNRAYFTILRAFPWLFAEMWPPLQIVTAPKVVLTNIVATPDNPDITVAETILSSLNNRKFVLDRDGISVRIATIAGAPSTITLAVPWFKDAISGGTGYLYQDEYVTPDVLVATRIKNLSAPGTPIAIIGYEELDIKAPSSIPFGTISLASYYTEDVIRFAPVPEAAQLLELYATKRPPKLDFTGGASDVPVMPHDERWMIADYSLFWILQDHNDDKAEEVGRIVAGRIGEAKDRQIAKMSARIWLPDGFNAAVR